MPLKIIERPIKIIVNLPNADQLFFNLKSEFFQMFNLKNSFSTMNNKIFLYVLNFFVILIFFPAIKSSKKFFSCIEVNLKLYNFKKYIFFLELL